MRILVVHNYYQEPGGEDEVFAAETELLKGHGHSVTAFTLHNDDIKKRNPLWVARATLWNSVEAEFR